jgi:hypothetical protein
VKKGYKVVPNDTRTEFAVLDLYSGTVVYRTELLDDAWSAVVRYSRDRLKNNT